MADKKTSDETAASTLTGAELVRGVQSAASVKITIDQIKTYISGNLGAATAKSLALAGAISAASWGLTGVGHTETARTITDTSGAGTVATGATHGLGGNTIAATNARTLTDYYSLYVKDSIAGTNVTLTNKWSLGLEGSVNVGGSVRVASSGSIGWSTDLKLWRDAANTLALQNGTSAQTFNLYGTWSSAGANYARLASYWSGTTVTIETQVSGTGSATSFAIGCPSALYLGSNSINFRSGGGTTFWYINSPGGHILAGTDNSWDIGASGANRPRNLFLGGSLTLASNITCSGNIGAGRSTSTCFLAVAAATTSKSALNFAAGAAPSAPADGDLWFDGTDFKARVGGVTKTFTLA